MQAVNRSIQFAAVESQVSIFNLLTYSVEQKNMHQVQVISNHTHHHNPVMTKEYSLHKNTISLKDMDSDDVSALSMDGASAIAGMGFARRIRKDFAKMQLEQLQEGEQLQVDEGGGGGGHNNSRSRPQHETLHASYPGGGLGELPPDGIGVGGGQREIINNGQDLIEPFPRTFEEWQKKKEKKHKSHKSKKQSKKSSKREHRDRDRGERHHRSREDEQQVQYAQHMMEMNNGQAPPPIMEISIQSTNFHKARGGTSSVPLNNTSATSSPRRGSDLGGPSESALSGRSYPSMRSTDSSSNSRPSSAMNITHGKLLLDNSSKTASTTKHSSSFRSEGAMGMALRRSQQQQHRSSRSLNRSLGNLSRGLLDEDNHSHMTGHNSTTGASQSHMTGGSISHVTIEDIEKLRICLEQARNEEKQVLAIHSRLENEVLVAQDRSTKASASLQSTNIELQAENLEREYLRKSLAHVENENKKLKSKLRHLEDKEDGKGLDDVLDSMEAKIKLLKKKREKSKPSSPSSRSKSKTKGGNNFEDGRQFRQSSVSDSGMMHSVPTKSNDNVEGGQGVSQERS